MVDDSCEIRYHCEQATSQKVNGHESEPGWKMIRNELFYTGKFNINIVYSQCKSIF